MSKSANPFPVLTLGLLLLLSFAACKNEDAPAESAETATSVQQVGQNVPTEVRNQAGEPVTELTIFETRPSGSGSVYSLRTGMGSVTYEKGVKYKIRAAGYKDLDFEFTMLQEMKHIVFYLNAEGNAGNSPVIMGTLLDEDNAPHVGASTATSGNRLGQTDAEGRFSFEAVAAGAEDSGTPITLGWKDKSGADRMMTILFTGDSMSDTMRVDVRTGTLPPVIKQNSEENSAEPAAEQPAEKK
jgi:hypothetical protein